MYGAGVIGSYYATLLAAAGEDVSLLARGRRLGQFRSRRDINVLDRVADSELFDFIFVAVRSNRHPVTGGKGHIGLAALPSWTGRSAGRCLRAF